MLATYQGGSGGGRGGDGDGKHTLDLLRPSFSPDPVPAISAWEQGRREHYTLALHSTDRKQAGERVQHPETPE